MEVNPMNTKQLQYVVVLAEEQNFTKAAKRLFIAQPSLSQYISKLEQELGHTLFDRSTSPLRLTVAGELYVEMARRILDMEMQTEKCLNDMQEGQYGQLIVGAAPHRSRCILSRHIKGFLAKYPHYDVVLRECSYQQMMKSLDMGELDFCIVTAPINEGKYNVEVIMEEDILLAVPKAHPIHQQFSSFLRKDFSSYPIVDLSNFRDMIFLTVGKGNGMYELTYDLCWEAGFRPRKTIECGSFDVCRDLVEDGVGVSLLQSSIIEYNNNRNGIQCYRLLQSPPSRKVAAVYRKKGYLSNAAQDFIDMLKNPVINPD